MKKFIMHSVVFGFGLVAGVAIKYGLLMGSFEKVAENYPVQYMESGGSGQVGNTGACGS